MRRAIGRILRCRAALPVDRGGLNGAKFPYRMLHIREIDHVVLRVRDIDAMTRFYCDVLGEPFDQQAIVAHLRKHGVTIGDVRPRFGAEGNGVSVYLTDPEGNTVELKGPSDGKPPPGSK
jgi:catechol-2,3-dioxygenase